MTNAPYRETISRSAEVDYAHKSQSPRGEYARVKLRLQPLARGEGFEFAIDKTENGVPPRWWSGVEKGVTDAAKSGVVNGGEVVDCRITFYDGNYHHEDSNSDTFYIAAREAFWQGMRKASAKLPL